MTSTMASAESVASVQSAPLPPVQRVFQERLGCSLLQHSVVLLTAGCLQGFTMIPGSGANSRLALTAHYKTFLHAALMAAAGSASSAGACASLGRTAGICSFWLLAGGCWLSFYADVRASFLGIGLPMAATAAKAVVDEEHVNSKLIVLSAASVLAGMDLRGLAFFGGSGGAGEQKRKDK